MKTKLLFKYEYFKKCQFMATENQNTRHIENSGWRRFGLMVLS